MRPTLAVIFRNPLPRWHRAGFGVIALAWIASAHAQAPAALGKFVTAHCVECHDADTKEGRLDLTSLAFAPAEPKNFTAWVKVHDRVASDDPFSHLNNRSRFSFVSEDVPGTSNRSDFPPLNGAGGTIPAEPRHTALIRLICADLGSLA